MIRDSYTERITRDELGKKNTQRLRNIRSVMYDVLGKLQDAQDDERLTLEEITVIHQRMDHLELTICFINRRLKELTSGLVRV